MNEIKELLAKWQEASYVNPDGLEAAHNAIIMLIIKIEDLEKQIEDLKSL